MPNPVLLAADTDLQRRYQAHVRFAAKQFEMDPWLQFTPVAPPDTPIEQIIAAADFMDNNSRSFDVSAAGLQGTPEESVVFIVLPAFVDQTIEVISTDEAFD